MEEWNRLHQLGLVDYSVSSMGRVRNDRFDRIMRLSINQQGIVKIGLIPEGSHTPKTYSVARLVAHYFLDPPRSEAFDTPIHLNGNRTDCRADNLMWRPRWFAVVFHRQFQDPIKEFAQPIICLDTDEIFDNCREPAMRYGVLESEVFSDVTNQGGVWPDHIDFRLLDDYEE